MLIRLIILALMLAAICGAGAADEKKVIRLSLEECIERAMRKNLDVEIARINPRLARYSLDLARTSYDPFFRAGATHSSSSSPGGVDEENRFFLGTETEDDRFNTGFGGQFPIGLSYDLSGNVSNRRGSSAAFPFENSSGSIRLNVTQPLLKNFLIDGIRLNIKQRKTDLLNSEIGFRRQIIGIVTAVELAYYGLISAREQLAVRRDALILSEKSYAGDKRKVEEGIKPSDDLKRSGAEVARVRADVNTAIRSVKSAEYNLIQVISDDVQSMDLATIEPTEKIQAVKQPLDRHVSWGRGLRMRLDLQQSRNNLENVGLTLRYNKNQLLPQLDFQATLGRSAANKEYPGVFSSLSKGDSPFWSYGAILRMPLGNRSARLRYKSEKLRYEGRVLDLKKLEQSIMVDIAIEVDRALGAFEQVELSRQARELAEQALESEEKQLEFGKSSSYQVQQLQRDLTTARSREVSSVIDYNRALARLAQAEGTTLERHKIDVESE
ncbi:MAG: TolC family protein [Verrucomicrobiia bacterium]|jgi:outer membrane protein